MLGVVLAAAAPARAGTITFGDVVRRVGADGQLRPASEVRLRFGAQAGLAAQPGGPTQSSTTSPSSPDHQQASGAQPSGQSGTTGTSSSDPTLSQSGGKVETVDLGDVTGTVCDCGEIPAPPKIPGGAFPWWTLVGIPLVCISGICAGGGGGEEGCVTNCGGGPTPTPTPPGVPEPMSLLLFGSGLLAVGAGARRRRARKQLACETHSVTTEEV